jgi:hypothetical protein
MMDFVAKVEDHHDRRQEEVNESENANFDDKEEQFNKDLHRGLGC